MYQCHKFLRQLRIEGVSLHQEAKHCAAGHGHRDYRVVVLGEDRVARHSGGEPAGVRRVADDEGKGAFDGLGIIRVAAGLPPGKFLLNAPAPRIPD
jgi:hypothetical protein